MVKCSICKKEGHRSDNSRFHPKAKITTTEKTNTKAKTKKKTKSSSTTTHTSTIRIRTEVQSHGFTWEGDLLKNVYGASDIDITTIKYNSKVDLPHTLNRIGSFDLSIKTTNSQNAVCMADCLRLYDMVGNDTSTISIIPFHLVVVFYRQDDTRNMKIVKNIVEVDLTNARELLFGKITRPQLEELVNAIKAVPQKRKPSEEEYTTMYAIRDKLQPLMGSHAIHLDIKCNSQQSRLQCSFNRFQEFIKENPSRIVAQSNTGEFRGGKIASEISSSRRTFNKSK